MKGYVAYLRKSLDEKGKQIYSIKVQKQLIKEMAEKYNIKINKFLPPEKKSGGNKKRPIFLEMLKMIERGEYEGIAAYSVDRLTRNLMDADKLLDLIIEKDMKLFIATMPGMDWQTPEGVIVFVQFASWGIVERMMAKMRTMRTHKFLRVQGKHIGEIPYGYRKIQKGKEYSIKVIPEEADKIRRIFALAAELGYGRRRISKIIGLEEGHVRSILENERYTGYIVVNDEIVKLELPPIIPVETFCILHPAHELCKLWGKNAPGKNRE